MSFAETFDTTDDLPEISQAAYDKIDRWAVVLDRTPLLDKRTTFEAAAADIWAEAERETNLAAVQSIADSILVLAENHAGIDYNTAEFILTGTKAHAKITRAVAGADQLDDGSPVPSPRDYGSAVPATIDDASAIVPAKFITPAAWPDEAPPPVDWLVASRIPRGDVTTLHGDGGAGKTDITLRLFANVARGTQDWLGHEIAAGKVLFVSGEEPERELWRRMWLRAKAPRACSGRGRSGGLQLEQAPTSLHRIAKDASAGHRFAE
jgi:hypothetical protein